MPGPDEHQPLYRPLWRNRSSVRWMPHRRKWVHRLQSVYIKAKGCRQAGPSHLGSCGQLDILRPDWSPGLPATSLLPIPLASMDNIVINKDGNCRIVSNDTYTNTPLETILSDLQKVTHEIFRQWETRTNDAMGSMSWGSMHIRTPGVQVGWGSLCSSMPLAEPSPSFLPKHLHLWSWNH